MLYILINRVAGNGRAARIGEQIAGAARELGFPHAILFTEYAGHATELAREAARSGVETVVAVGGDGTVQEVVLGLYGTETALGIIPAGTGNDASKMLGLPKKPMDALKFILENPARGVDAGMVNDSIFFNVGGVGFDVCTLEYANKAKKYVRGMLPYLWGVLCSICAFRPFEIIYEVDGESEVTRTPLIAAVANGPFFGGGITIAPNAFPDDGLFDLVFVDAMPRYKLPFQLPKLVSGRVMEIPGVEVRRCKRVVLSAPGMRVNMDGEIKAMERAEFQIQPRALKAHW